MPLPLGRYAIDFQFPPFGYFIDFSATAWIAGLRLDPLFIYFGYAHP